MAKKNIVQKRMIWQKPEIDGGRIGNNPLLLRISVGERETKIDFGYSAYNIYIKGGWIRIHPDTYLEDTKTMLRYKMIKAVDIPIYPEKLEFKTKTDWQYFSLYFEPLPHNDLIINFIEPDKSIHSDNGNNFNFYKIKLNTIDALDEYKY
jgi:hypothetical protein